MIMRKYIYIFCFVLLGITGCADFIDVRPENSTTYTNYFRTQKDAEALLNGVMYYMRMAINLRNSADIVDDNVNSSINNNLDPFRNLSSFSGYGNLIYQANLILDNAHRFEISEEELKPYLLQAYFAKGVALANNLPLIPVHHLRAHVAANYITYQDLVPPFLCLIVSGGHSHIVEVKGYTDLKVIGQTRDDAAGEALDKVARVMGMPYPGGANLDKQAEKGNEKAYKLPRPFLKDSEYDFSFSGLKTAVINQVHNSKQKGEIVDEKDMSASFRAAVVDCLMNNFIKAAKNLGHNKLALAGGVAANTLLRRRLNEECKRKNWKAYIPDISLCGGTAAMVGAQAYYEYECGNVATMDLNAYATLSIDNLI